MSDGSCHHNVVMKAPLATKGLTLLESLASADEVYFAGTSCYYCVNLMLASTQ